MQVFRWRADGSPGKPPSFTSSKESFTIWKGHMKGLGKIATSWSLVYEDERYLLAVSREQDTGAEFILWVKKED